MMNSLRSTGRPKTFKWKLNLAFNGFTTELPSGFSKLDSLTHLNLSNSGFNGQIPISFSRLTRLVTLDLSGTQTFSGPSPVLIDPNLEIITRSLTTLKELMLDGIYISDEENKWSRTLSSSLPKLEVLSLSQCSLSGPFDPSFSQLQSLSKLQLSWTNFSTEASEERTHEILRSGGRRREDLARLDGLDARQGVRGQREIDRHDGDELQEDDVHRKTNGFTGPVPLFSGSESLEYIGISSNRLTGPIHSEWNNLPKLGQLGKFPDISSSMLESLDLSNNQFQGPIPVSISKLNILNLRSNNISGTTLDMLFHKLRNLKELDISDLSNNQIHGKIPNWISKIGDGDLRMLNLSNNFLEDLDRPLPVNSFQYFVYLDMHSNMLQGKNPILPSLGARDDVGSADDMNGLYGFPMLRIIDISSNGFSGVLSKECLSGWKAMMGYETKAEWNRKDQILGIEYLRGKKLNYQVEITNKGIEVKMVKIVTAFTSIDFSNNKLEGTIPKAIGNFTPVYNFNFSRNSLTGSIPYTFGNPKHLESLDLSQNKLTGEIPFQLTSLSTLSVLNPSFNQSEGRIP
ncbi:hypothetical protein C5167_025515 [Papaver somniferum]|uniref:Uncharacterized protein n=1 Tax=Papaver somniferum TaxID=3469 RepID=A0A4Y7JRN6_PAPSO|nr:hypothetical protein C5167_025515 [Papaver somniferum]